MLLMIQVQLEKAFFNLLIFEYLHCIFVWKADKLQCRFVFVTEKAGTLYVDSILKKTKKNPGI